MVFDQGVEVSATGKWHDFNALVEYHAESESVNDSMTRLTRILDANYDTPVLEDEVAKMTHLNPIQRNLLLALLKENESLFDGQLGDWVGDPIEIPLRREPNRIMQEHSLFLIFMSRPSRKILIG